MPTGNTWVICEQTGRWAAALRVEFARASGTAARPKPRIFETRSLEELALAIKEHAPPLAFVEIRPETAPAALSFVAKSTSLRTRFTALLDFGDELAANGQLTSDALLEAGAITVVSSSRQLAVVLRIAERQAAASSKCAAPDDVAESITARAWAALPWQEA